MSQYRRLLPVSRKKLKKLARNIMYYTNVYTALVFDSSMGTSSSWQTRWLQTGGGLQKAMRKGKPTLIRRKRVLYGTRKGCYKSNNFLYYGTQSSYLATTTSGGGIMQLPFAAYNYSADRCRL